MYYAERKQPQQFPAQNIWFIFSQPQNLRNITIPISHPWNKNSSCLSPVPSHELPRMATISFVPVTVQQPSLGDWVTGPGSREQCQSEDDSSWCIPTGDEPGYLALVPFSYFPRRHSPSSRIPFSYLSGEFSYLLGAIFLPPGTILLPPGCHCPTSWYNSPSSLVPCLGTILLPPRYHAHTFPWYLSPISQVPCSYLAMVRFSHLPGTILLPPGYLSPISQVPCSYLALVPFSYLLGSIPLPPRYHAHTLP